jgi:hypothetical protein
MVGPLRSHREIWWFLVPLALCPLVALIEPGDAARAMARAHQLVPWERALGISIEPSVHSWVEDRPVLARAVDVLYVTAHLSASIATAL